MSVAPAGTTNVLVVVSGVVQDPSTYGVVGNTLTFSTAPPSGTGNISCRYLGVPVTGVATTAYRTLTTFTATASQTTFTPPSYTVGYINVYRNGVLLTPTSDYTASNGTTVVLATGATAGDTVIVESFLVSSVLNALPQSGGTLSGNLVVTGTETIGTDLTVAGNVGIGTVTAASGFSELVINGNSSGGHSNNAGIQLNYAVSPYGGGAITTASAAGGGLVFYTYTGNIGSETYVERMRLNSTGALVLSGGTTTANGIGITFPASQSASTNPNTLDDYEEGTWTPVMGGFTGVTYSEQIGSYTKIGNMVYAFWDLTITSKSGSGNNVLSGLPFTISNSMAGYSVVMHRAADLLNSNGVTYGQLKGYAEKGNAYLVLQVDYSTTASFGTAGGVAYNATGRSSGYVIYQAA
jgi:hypothetical protein